MPKQYIGETKNALRFRFNNHKSSIRLKNMSQPVSAHFNQPGHTISHLFITGIDYWHEWTESTRKSKESFWIAQMQTKSPMGLNLAE